MTVLEERLRTELHTLAQQVQPGDLRPLRAPEPRRAPAGRRWVAAAAAVLVVVALVAAVNAVAHHDRVPPAVHPVPMPRFYLYAGDDATSRKGLTVRSSATGRVLDTLRAPAGHSYGLVMGAAADGRTFVFSDMAHPGTSHATFTFREVRLTEAGRVAAMATVPGSFRAGRSQYVPVSAAVNPDGSEFAVSFQQEAKQPVSKGAGVTRVDLVSVATGRVLRAWTAPAYIQAVSLAWSGGRLSLAVTDHRDDTTPTPGVAQLRVLDPTGAGGSLLGSSTVLPVHPPRGRSLRTGQLTPDGRLIVAWVSYRWRQIDRHLLQEYSARTGRLVRTLYNPQPDRGLRVSDRKPDRHILNQVWPVAVDQSGQHVLIQGMNTYGDVIIGRVDGGRFTALPTAGSSSVTSTFLETW